MIADLVTLLVGGAGALIGATIQYRFQLLSAGRQERKEITETHFLQLQDALESLYFRSHNISGRGGKRLMSDEYFKTTSIYAIARVLAHENLLVARSIYAKLHYNTALKHQLKAGIHRVIRSMNEERFLHYHRLQLAEILLKDGKVVSFTEFLSRAGDNAFQPAMTAAAAFVENAPNERFAKIAEAAKEVVELLVVHTKVPSALNLRAT